MESFKVDLVFPHADAAYQTIRCHVLIVTALITSDPTDWYFSVSVVLCFQTTRQTKCEI
jgi:hypothetical protein